MMSPDDVELRYLCRTVAPVNSGSKVSGLSTTCFRSRLLSREMSPPKREREACRWCSGK